MKYINLFFILTSYLYSGAARIANDNNHHNPSHLGVDTAQSYTLKVMELHPEIISLNNEVKAAEFRLNTAKAFKNPELESEGVFGATGYGGESSLVQTFELGSKRKRRVDSVRSEIQRLNAQKTLMIENVAVSSMVSLHRLRQLEIEMEKMEEAKASFLAIRKQYKKLIRLSPEQTVSLGLIEMIENNLLISIARLSNEEEGIRAHLKNFLGCNSECNELELDKLTPAPIVNWPALNKNTPYLSENGEYLIAKNKIDLAENQYNLSKSQVWPDLAIGPKLEYGSDSFQVGFTFSIPLPILNFNKGERRANKLILENENNKLSIRQIEIQRKRDILVNNYHNLIQSISNKDLSLIEKNHKKLHQYIDLGVLPFSLIVKAHNEQINYFTQLHQAELEAISYFWSVLAIDGQILETLRK